VRDQVEADVDTAGLGRDRIGVLVDSLLVKRVQLCCVRYATCRADLLGDGLEL
jgi:hypothetical protein